MAACTKSVDLPGTTAEGSDASPPCGLFASGQIENILNVPVDSLQLRGRPVLAGMQMCAAGSQGSSAAWGVLKKAVTTRLKEYERINQGYLEDVRVNGRPASWDRRMGTLVVRAEDMAIGVRLRVEKPILKKNQTPPEYLKDTASRLAGNMIQQLSNERS
ncbi:MAG: hypothetical protein ACR2M4_02675 [Actinomycetota bacterium]